MYSWLYAGRTTPTYLEACMPCTDHFFSWSTKSKSLKRRVMSIGFTSDKMQNTISAFPPCTGKNYSHVSPAGFEEKYSTHHTSVSNCKEDPKWTFVFEEERPPSMLYMHVENDVEAKQVVVVCLYIVIVEKVMAVCTKMHKGGCSCPENNKFVRILMWCYFRHKVMELKTRILCISWETVYLVPENTPYCVFYL